MRRTKRKTTIPFSYERLQEICDRKGETLYSICKQTGIKNSNIYRWKQTGFIDYNALDSFARLLDSDILYLQGLRLHDSGYTGGKSIERLVNNTLDEVENRSHFEQFTRFIDELQVVFSEELQKTDSFPGITVSMDDIVVIPKNTAKADKVITHSKTGKRYLFLSPKSTIELHDKVLDLVQEYTHEIVKRLDGKEED